MFQTDRLFQRGATKLWGADGDGSWTQHDHMITGSMYLHQTHTRRCAGLSGAHSHGDRHRDMSRVYWGRSESRAVRSRLQFLELNIHLCLNDNNNTELVGDRSVMDDGSDRKAGRGWATYCLVLSREAHILVVLWVAVIWLEYKGESVAWRQDGLVAWVIPISRVFIATELPEQLFIIKNLTD